MQHLSHMCGGHKGYGIGMREGITEMERFFERKHVGVIAAYAIFYVLSFFILERDTDRDYNMIHTALDDLIPFCEYFVIPYLLWFVYIAGVVVFFAFFNQDVKEYWQLVLSLALGMTLFLLVSWGYPNGHQLRPVTFERDNIFVDLVKGLYKADTSTNVLPSIHVFNSVAVYVAVSRCQKLRRCAMVRRGAFILSFLIVLSTMFLKQHSVVDVICALILNAVVYLIIYLPKEQWGLARARSRSASSESKNKGLFIKR